MARHRNIRNLNFQEERDYDEVFGRSLEDDVAVSPATAAQFMYPREKDSASLSSYMRPHPQQHQAHVTPIQPQIKPKLTISEDTELKETGGQVINHPKVSGSGQSKKEGGANGTPKIKATLQDSLDNSQFNVHPSNHAPSLMSVINQSSVSRVRCGNLIDQATPDPLLTTPTLKSKPPSASYSATPTLGDMIGQSSVPSSATPTLGDLIGQGSVPSSATPTLGDLIGQSSATPTLGDLIGQSSVPSSATPILGDLIGRRSLPSSATPTLGDLIGQSSVPSSATPTLGDLIGQRSVHSSATPTLGDLIGQSSVPSSATPTLGDLIGQSSVPSSATPTLSETVCLSILSDESTQSSSHTQSSIGGPPPGFSSRPCVPNPIKMARLALEDNEHLEVSEFHSKQSENESLYDIQVVSTDSSSSMVGVVLSDSNHLEFKNSKQSLERKDQVLSTLNKKLFSRKRFNFSTPSPDEYILQQQKKAFRI